VALAGSPFAGDEHQAVIPAQLLDVVRLGEPMDLSAQLFGTVIDAFQEEKITHRNVQRFSQPFHSSQGWGLDAAGFDMSYVLGTSANLFRQLGLREALCLPEGGELLAEQYAQISAHCTANLLVRNGRLKITRDMLDSENYTY